MTRIRVDRQDVVDRVYLQLTGDDEGRVCRDIPEAACNAQPENFLKHVMALLASKAGDGLVDPKLVLPWLLGALGAPAFFTGLLVPIREAGALLPQLVTAGSIRALPLRKYAWAIGSLVQGLAVIGMGIAAFSLQGEALGWTIVSLLVVMSLARSVCSVAYKDVLGKTVSKSTRGTATGTASTGAALVVFAFGALLALGWLPLEVEVIAFVLLVAGSCWLFAAAVFVGLDEVPGATEGGGNALSVVLEEIALLRTDGQLVRFIAVRGLLTSTALAPPFLLALGGRSAGAELGGLGLFVLASSAASVLSTYAWGRLSDVSSRRVLLYSGLVASLPLGAAGLLGLVDSGLLSLPAVLPGLLLVLMIAYQGVRLGRSTHVVDMADETRRAAYTALSNTVVGVLLLGASIFGALASAAGEAVVLLTFAVMAVLGALVAFGLDEVQEDA